MTNQTIERNRNGKKSVLLFSRLSVLLLLVVYLAGCDANQTISSEPEINSAELTSVMNSSADKKFDDADMNLIKMVKRATARYNSTNQALRAGYLESTHCVDHPELGGMGYHWVNPALIDDVYDITRPEVMLYEADSDGNFKLVAVEYVVLNTGQDHPYFGNYPFDVGGTPDPRPHWSLHVWLYKPNPNGIFTPFNPLVSC